MIAAYPLVDGVSGKHFKNLASKTLNGSKEITFGAALGYSLLGEEGKHLKLEKGQQ